MKKEFIEEINKLNLTQFILNYISNNQNIQKLLNENLEEDYDILYQNILKEFDIKAIDNIKKIIIMKSKYIHIYMQLILHY